MNYSRLAFNKNMSTMLRTLIAMFLLFSADATSEVKAQTRVNDVVAESWADEQDMANMIINRVNAVPSVEPSYYPTRSPTPAPTNTPSLSNVPSAIPSLPPSISLKPTITPTSSPSLSVAPSDTPTSSPSSSPSDNPSVSPSVSSMPSLNPTSRPSMSSEPSLSPTSSPSSYPSEAPSDPPTGQPTTRPTSSPSETPTTSPTLSPTSSAAPSTPPSVANTLKKDMFLIDDQAPRSTSLLIIGACAFIAVASTGVYLYRRGAQSTSRRNNGFGAPVAEISAEKDFEDGAMISPMSRVSGLPRNSYEPGLQQTNKRKCIDDDTDIELGEIPKSVYISTPNTTVAVSDSFDTKDNTFMKGVQKYWQNPPAKTNGPTHSNKKRMTWNQIRDEGSPACSSGCAPASVPSMFSPVPVRGLSLLLENEADPEENNKENNNSKCLALVKSGSADSISSKPIAIVKSCSAESHNSKSLAIVTTRSAESRSSMFMTIGKSQSTESKNSGSSGIIKSRSTESRALKSAAIEHSASMESSTSSFAQIMKSESAQSTATRSVKSKLSFFASNHDDSSNDDEALNSVRSTNVKSVQSCNSSNSGLKGNEFGENESSIAEKSAPSFEENLSEINSILNSIKQADDEDRSPNLYLHEPIRSKDDVQMSYSQTPPGPCVKDLSFSPRSSSTGSLTNKAESIRANDQITPQADGFGFIADFDNLTTRASSFGDETMHKLTNGAHLLSPITYEKDLQTSVTSQDFSFGNLLADPHNELYECHAPPGPLGIVIDSTPLGPRVKSLNPMSSLFNYMSPGDIIVGVDDVDTVGMEAAEFWQLVSRKANQRKRVLTMLKI
ncbi:hypothetical protein HJC23_003544 [Cyclotella cryptica]|uniref:PDZ domain-containing protein n=1 Tax=Cyclotella cryptica TaxID=29204 RepID=A0ABD3NZN0_9STRA|eukprot:CCRYP_018587-RB/>CCRYP_018587-RB protein AED:0.27 eAED:0.27 QI:197/1/1/1/0.75/0.6/5/669/836